MNTRCIFFSYSIFRCDENRAPYSNISPVPLRSNLNFRNKWKICNLPLPRARKVFVLKIFSVSCRLLYLFHFLVEATNYLSYPIAKRVSPEALQAKNSSHAWSVTNSFALPSKKLLYLSITAKHLQNASIIKFYQAIKICGIMKWCIY